MDRKHNLLVQRAVKHLEREGWKEIRKEETFSDINYRSDVTAIKDNKRIVVECGDLVHPNRMLLLSDYFDKVRHYPYITTRIKYSSKMIRDRKIERQIKIDSLESNLNEFIYSRQLSNILNIIKELNKLGIKPSVKGTPWEGKNLHCLGVRVIS